jgi:hypothetical protein
MKWRNVELPDPVGNPDAFKMAVRLNALGSLYFFESVVLQRDKLTNHLHKPILERLEAPTPRYLLEMPRDNYKTVMVSEGRTMWRALPFNDLDEAVMREWGYDDDFIALMKYTHNPSRRTLIVSEILDNAVKIGFRFDWHYRENKWFRMAFPEIIPDSKCSWNNESKTQRGASHGPNGEGTFDFLGVGGALQSRHYSDVVEDDVVGKDAIESELVMAKTIDYHRLLIGAFESYKGSSWTVVNNRWSPHDLSGWIRENQPEFVIESHRADGGCDPKYCIEQHPPGVAIFPEELSLEVLAEIRRVQGPVIFSHQYLNLPMNPEECIFKQDWLKFYEPVKAPIMTDEQKGLDRHWLKHEVPEGQKPIKDVDPKVLIRSMIVDPNHAGSDGRARHAIIVTGFDPDTDRIYLLDLWAASMSYDELMSNIYRLAKMWGLIEFWLETVAAQKYLKYHIEYRNKIEDRRLTVRELKSEHSKNSKRTRIESLEPLFRDGRFWVRRDQSLFLDEYYEYPGGRTVDILDCLGYATQTWNAIHAKKILDLVKQRKDRWTAGRKNTKTGY